MSHDLAIVLAETINSFNQRIAKIEKDQIKYAHALHETIVKIDQILEILTGTE